MSAAAGKKIVIINYGMGNLHSLQNAFVHLKADSVITADPEVIRNADVLMLPGVGSFRLAMNNLVSTGITEAIDHAVTKRAVPFMGICLGMQLLADEGEEDGMTKGLGLISGQVVKFTDTDLRLPHIGFNSVEKKQNHPEIFDGIDDNGDFYFVHSYHFKSTAPQHIIGTTRYSFDFVSAVQKDNVFGMQFHPEKSQSNGLKLLSNFIRIAGRM